MEEGATWLFIINLAASGRAGSRLPLRVIAPESSRVINTGSECLSSLHVATETATQVRSV